MQGSCDRAGRRKRESSGGVVVFTSSSFLIIIWDGLGTGRVRLTKELVAGNPTGKSSGTPGVTTVAGGRQGIGESTLLARPGATAPARKGKVRPRLYEFERAYGFGRCPMIAVSSALFEAQTLKSGPRLQ